MPSSLISAKTLLVMKAPETDDSILRSSEFIGCDLDGGKVLMDTRSGDYYHLNSVAGHIWERAAVPKPVGELIRELGLEYNCSHEQLEKEVIDFLHDFAQLGIVKSTSSIRGRHPTK